MPPVWSVHLPPEVDPSSLDLNAGGTLPGAFRQQWLTQAARPLVCDPNGSWASGAELEARTAAGAQRLAAAGLSPGDRLVISAETSLALVVAYAAALRAGLVVVPINPAYTQGEVERIVRVAGPAGALVDDRRRGEWIDRAVTPRRSVVIAGIDLVGLPGAVELSGAADLSGPGEPLDRLTASDPALLLYTSGTTGAPKGALLSHGNLLSSAHAVRLAWRWTIADRLLLTLPLFHMHGLGVGINGGLVSGGQIVLRSSFDAGDVASRAADGLTTMFFGVPAIYQRLAGSGHLATLSGLRLLVSGSAPLSSALSDEVMALTGQRPLERYGMTETVMITSNPIDGPRKAGRVGVALPGVEVRLAAGGEVEVSGPNVLAGYDVVAGADDTANAEAFTSDGWFRTGDLGEFDEDGHLQLVGRSKELIISGGFNVYPREVEEALAAFPGVREVAVIGRPSEQWGEAVTAVVVPDGPRPDVAALRAFAARQLAPYKVPKAVEFIDKLPRNALGKVVRRDL